MHPVASQALEVAPIGQTLRGVGSRQLVEREALRSGAGELDGRAMGDLKARADLYAPILELGDGPRQISHAVHEHRLLALEMTCQQQRWRLRAQSNHGHPSPGRFDRKHELGAELIREVLQIRRYVPAGEVDEVERVEHERERTLLRGLARLALEATVSPCSTT